MRITNERNSKNKVFTTKKSRLKIIKKFQRKINICHRKIEFEKEHADQEKILRVHCPGITSNACSIP